jgi:hypothetical protein
MQEDIGRRLVVQDQVGGCDLRPTLGKNTSPCLKNSLKTKKAWSGG